MQPSLLTMNEAISTARSLLKPGERVLWQSVQPFGKESQIAPDSAHSVFWGAVLWLALAILFLVLTLRFPLDPTGEMIGLAVSVACFAYGVVKLSQSPFFVRWNHFSLIMHTPSFVSGIITDQRVLLFNNPSGRMVVLDRSDLASPVPELEEGTLALLLTSRSTQKRYLLITDRFVSAMRALRVEASDNLEGARS